MLTQRRQITSSEAKENNRTLPLSSGLKLELILISICRILLYGAGILFDKRDTFSQLIFVCLIIDLRNHFKTITHQAKPLQDEALHPNTGDLIKLDKEKPFEARRPVGNSETFFRWEIGEMKLYRHVEYMINFFETLRPDLGNNILSIPQPFRPYRKFFPHATTNFDMPSKGRILDSLVLFPLFKGRNMALWLKLSSDYSGYFMLAYAGLRIWTAVRESYLLNEIQLRLNLEGYNYKYQPFFSCPPPTCIGTQLTREIGFHPYNRNQQLVLRYVFDGEQMVRHLIKLTKDVELRKKLEKFKYLLEERASGNSYSQQSMWGEEAKRRSFPQIVLIGNDESVSLQASNKIMR